MSRSAIFPICFFILLASYPLYHFKGKEQTKKREAYIEQLRAEGAIQNSIAAPPQTGHAIPTTHAAILTAEAILKNQYGEDAKNIKPYNVSLDNDVWTVFVSSPSKNNLAPILIDKINGKILK
ncbi:MAG: NTF2 fold immunity protein [Dysgonomonas sp.]|nr:NTF2 fold immunity protein [Dysgonomonas sp.]